MSFGRTKKRLMALINRKDFTPELAGDFILDAMATLERELRIGPMETVFDKSDWDGVRNAFPIPANYIETIRMFHDGGTYDEVDLDTFLNVNSRISPRRRVYTRVADRWLLKPTPAPGEYVYLHFYGETLRPSVDTDETVWTEAGFLPLLYKAAELASDFYQMEGDQVQMYRQKALEAIAALADQSLMEAWSGRLSIDAPKDVGAY